MLTFCICCLHMQTYAWKNRFTRITHVKCRSKATYTNSHSVKDIYTHILSERTQSRTHAVSYTYATTVLQRWKDGGGVKGQHLTEPSLALNEEDGKQIPRKIWEGKGKTKRETLGSDRKDKNPWLQEGESKRGEKQVDVGSQLKL